MSVVRPDGEMKPRARWDWQMWVLVSLIAFVALYALGAAFGLLPPVQPPRGDLFGQVPHPGR